MSKFFWRFYFMMSLLMFIFFLGLIFSNIIYKGCHNLNIATQLLVVLLIPLTALFYGLMQQEEVKNAKPISSDKERIKIK